MRRFGILAAALSALLVVAAVAFAQTQENTYTVTGKVTPSKAGTAKKPVPVEVKFGYTVDEKTGKRPGLIRQYNIKIDGVRVNGARFPKCTFKAISAAKSDAKCPKGSLMGTGTVRNLAGPTADPSNKDTKCQLGLKVYNGGANKGVLFLRGSQADPVNKCPLAVAQAIDANYIASASGVSLRFNVGGPLHNPIPGVDNAVVFVNSTIRRATTKYRGKTVGYYESIGGCKAKKRYITVTFTPKTGLAQKAQKTLACTSA